MTGYGDSLAEHVQQLRSERGDTVGLSEVAGIVETLIESMEGDVSAGQITLRNDLRDLVDYIEQVRGDIAALSPSDIHDEHIPAAADELDAVVKATEEATDAILDAAESLETLGSEVSGETGERISEIVTKIYEASNFQDITGQRINKVVTALRHIETKVRQLAEAVGFELSRKLSESEAVQGPPSEEDLLAGPQLPGGGNSQDDIDALLASFD
jgi:chemotaxis protein CheZ